MPADDDRAVTLPKVATALALLLVALFVAAWFHGTLVLSTDTARSPPPPTFDAEYAEANGRLTVRHLGGDGFGPYRPDDDRLVLAEPGRSTRATG